MKNGQVKQNVNNDQSGNPNWLPLFLRFNSRKIAGFFV